MTRSLSIFVAAITVLLTMTACATAPRPSTAQSDLRRNCDLAVAKAQQSDPSLAKTLLDSAGYAVFPTVGKDTRRSGASHTTGALYEYDTFVGFCDLTQAPTSLRLADRAHTQIVVFQTELAVYHFKGGKLAFEAGNGADTIKSSSVANVNYSNGVAVFTVNDAGGMYEASIGGQTFDYQVLDRTNAVAQLDGF